MYQVRSEFTLRINRARQGLVIHGEAFKKDEYGHEQLFAQADYPYPTHSASRLHAALYGAAIRLNVSVQAAVRNAEVS
jgi:hypothetical protein